MKRLGVVEDIKINRGRIVFAIKAGTAKEWKLLKEICASITKMTIESQAKNGHNGQTKLILH